MNARALTIPEGAYFLPNSLCSTVRKYTSQELARLRIHVERLIGLVKQNYTILDGILPLHNFRWNSTNFFNQTENDSDLSVCDKLMVICCSLVN